MGLRWFLYYFFVAFAVTLDGLIIVAVVGIFATYSINPILYVDVLVSHIIYFFFFKVFEETTAMFGRRSRLNSRKRLVLFVTTKSDSYPETLQSEIKNLEDSGVDITVVAIGNKVDTTELEIIAPKDGILIVDPSGSPKTAAPEVIEHVIKGNWH